MTTNIITEKLSLASDTVLVKLYGGVTGIKRQTNKEEEERDGKTVHTTREVTTTQADAAEAEKAKKLLNQLRSTVDKYCTTVVNITVTRAGQLEAMRTEIAPIQLEIEAHNATARFHKVDRALFCAPISLQADPAALAEICRQISDELKVALAFFTLGDSHDGVPALPNGAADLKTWLAPVNNWCKRTEGMGALFPTVTGQCIGEAIDSVKPLRDRVAGSARAFEKAGQSPESALRSALKAVGEVAGALGNLETAIGLTAVTDSDAKAASDAIRAEGGGVEAVH